MPVTSIQTVVVILLTLICSYTDWAKGLVYNAVTYSGVALGVLLSFVSPSPDPFSSFAGLAAALVVFGLLWYVRGMGAGDVKLLAAVGALKGLPFLLNSSIYILAIAAMVGVIVLAVRGRLLRTLKWVGLTFISLFIPGMSSPGLPGERTQIPFAPFVFIGVAIAVYLEYLRGPFTL